MHASTSQPSGSASPVVFYVEDEEDIRENMSYLLGQQGFRVIPCDSAETFYKSFLSQPSGVVVLDIGLPGEDGLSICKYMRQHRPELGIVFVTARDQMDDRLQGLSSGGDAYLTKPFDTEELVAVIKRLHLVSNLNLVGNRPEDGPSARQEEGLQDIIRASSVDSSVARDDAEVHKRLAAQEDLHAWSYEPDAGLLRGPNRAIRKFSGNERTVMNLLTKEMDNALSVDDLGAGLGLPDDELRKKRVEVIISRMRRNVLVSIGLPLPLLLFRGLGYRLRGVRLV